MLQARFPVAPSTTELGVETPVTLTVQELSHPLLAESVTVPLRQLGLALVSLLLSPVIPLLLTTLRLSFLVHFFPM